MKDSIKNAEYELLGAILKKYDFLNDIERQLWFEAICLCHNDVDFFYRIYDSLNGKSEIFQSRNKKVEYSSINDRYIIKCDMRSAEHTNEELKQLIPGIIGIIEEILPLGSLVELNLSYKNPKESKIDQLQIVITHRFISPEGESDYFEYGGIPYPTGMLQGDKVLFFTNRSVKNIKHKGYTDLKDKQFIIAVKNALLIEKGVKSMSFSDNYKYKIIQKQSGDN